MQKQEMTQNSPYLRLLGRIELPDTVDPRAASNVKVWLVERAVYRLNDKGHPIGQAWYSMWGGGEFQNNAAVVAAVNGWKKIPRHMMYINSAWFELAAPECDVDVDAVADEVAAIQLEDEAARVAKAEKAAERAAARKEARLLKERGYVIMYVNPEDIGKINGMLRHGARCDVRDRGSRKVLVLSQPGKGD